MCPWVNACPSSCLLLSLRNTVLLPAMLLAFFGTLGHQVSCAVWPLVGNPPGQTLCSILGYEWGPGPKHPLTSPGGNHSHPSPGVTPIPARGAQGGGLGACMGPRRWRGLPGPPWGPLDGRRAARCLRPLERGWGPGSPWDAQGRGAQDLRETCMGSADLPGSKPQICTPTSPTPGSELRGLGCCRG